MRRIKYPLEYVKRLDAWPRRIPVPKLQGTKRMGINYEKKFGDYLTQILFKSYTHSISHNPWFEFKDTSKKIQYAAPDFLIDLGEFILILETKLTHREKAESKLLNFYRPLVEATMPGRKSKCVQVFKNFQRGQDTALLLDGPMRLTNPENLADYCLLNWRPL